MRKKQANKKSAYSFPDELNSLNEFKSFKSVATKENNKIALPPPAPPHPTLHHTTLTARASTAPSPPHQRTRCLKFTPSLQTIQINNRRNAEEVYCEREECPLIELPSKGRRGEGRGAFHALLTRPPQLLNVKRNFSICY